MPELVHPSQLDSRLVGLQRPPRSGFTAGLCRALAERWGVDPLIVRLAAIALTLAGGVGIGLYAWGWMLTPRVGGQPPILRLFPAFSRWTTTTQTIIIAASLLAVLLSGSSKTGVALGPVLVVAVLVWALSRKRGRASGVSSTPSPAAPYTGVVGVTTQADGESVEAWRARLGNHAGSPLPTVDLYAPEPAPSQAPVPASRAPQRTSWGAAAAVVLLTGLAGAVPLMLGMQPALLWGCVAAGGTAGVSLLLWSMVSRRRRMPGALLILALVGAVGSGLLAVNHSAAVTVPLEQASNAVAQYSFVGEVDGQLDLTGIPADEAATVTIDATASVVHVRLAAAPRSVLVEGDAINVVQQPSRVADTPGNVDLILVGDFSIVALEVSP
ncbi:PspC domain-containing protein [Tessaracoccus sp.]